jgi:hypothetical protein
MIKVSVIGDKELMGLLAKASQKVRRAQPCYNRLGLYMAREARKRLRAKGGIQDRQIAVTISHRADDGSTTVGASHPGARLRQLGGTVTAGKSISPVTGKLTKFLAIPIVKGLARQGIWPRDLWAAGDKRIFPLTGSDGRGYLVRHIEAKSKRGRARLEFLYQLVRKVVHKPFPYIVYDAAARQRFVADLMRYTGIKA